MRVLLVGATGTIGSEIAKALEGRHEVVAASRNSGVHVDIDDPESIVAMYREVGVVDAVICAAGSAVFAPLQQLGDDDFETSLRSKLMGSVNVVRFGIGSVRDGGSFALTTGILAQQPMPGGAAYAIVNAGLEGFVRVAALEMPRGIRVNAVSPDWISETLSTMGRDPAQGVPAHDAAKAYVEAIEGNDNGRIIAAVRAAV
jgi:NAD(P)-dependent dehydrogenase (short-subunit alcohol dehydrogenase family)